MPVSGPHAVSTQLQVKIPVKLARLLHIQAGDEVFWRMSEDEPDALVLLSAEVVERRYAVGERLEKLAQDPGAELEPVPASENQKNEV